MTRTLCCLMLSLASVSIASAQGYPARPVTVVVAVAPGGVVDVVARLIATELAPSLGQPITIENRPGAAGTVGLDIVARAVPDGHTLGVAWNSPLAINASMMKSLPYDPIESFVPITTLVSYPLYLTIRDSLPVRSAEEFIAYAKSNPKKLNFGSTGTFTVLAAALMSSTADIEMTEVQFNGNGPALNALLGGHIDVMMATLPPKGAVRVLAVTTKKRLGALPELPTLSEKAVPGFDVTGWLGFVAPKGTPPAIVSKINELVLAVLKKPDVRKRLTGLRLEVEGSSPQEFGAIIQEEGSKWRKVVKDAGIKPQ